MLRGGNDFLLRVGNCFVPASFDPLDGDVAVLGDDVAANGRQTLVAITAVRRGENLDVMQFGSFIKEPPHFRHHCMMKSSIYLIDEQNAVGAINHIEGQSEHAPDPV